MNELDRSLDALPSDFNFHGHLFPHSSPNHVKYAISLPDAWSHHQTLALRQTAMKDRSKRVGDVSEESSPCLQDFDLISHGMAKV